MSKVPSRRARLAHAAKHAELWNAGKKDDWVASWRTIRPGDVRMFDPVGTDLLIKTYYPMPESVGAEADPYAHLLQGQK
jgi:hypothetical protein